MDFERPRQIHSFNPRSPCGERLATVRFWNPPRFCFNPRSPCGERLDRQGYHPNLVTFQSTFPVWGTTSCSWPSSSQWKCFNPRSPCGERRVVQRRVGGGRRFQSTFPVWGTTDDADIDGCGRRVSIHVPRVGNDRPRCVNFHGVCRFNPRSPCGERHNPNVTDPTP